MLVVHNIDQPGNLYNTLIEHTVNIIILYNLNKDTTTILTIFTWLNAAGMHVCYIIRMSYENQ